MPSPEYIAFWIDNFIQPLFEYLKTAAVLYGVFLFVLISVVGGGLLLIAWQVKRIADRFEGVK
jgi:hypothetical protein